VTPANSRFPRAEPQSRYRLTFRTESIDTPYLTVLGLAVIELWFAVPAGFALGLPPLAVWLCTALGALIGVSIVTIGGDAVRRWFMRKRGREVLAGQGRLYRIWVRYGVIGWGLASPAVFAAPMGTAIALALGAPRGRLYVSMAAGVLLWTTIVVVAAALGIKLLLGG